jgi:hypothetical protein
VACMYSFLSSMVKQSVTWSMKTRARGNPQQVCRLGRVAFAGSSQGHCEKRGATELSVPMYLPC